MIIRTERHPAPAVILGASGFIGRSLSRCLEREGIAVIGLSSRDCDLLDPAPVKAALEKIQGRFRVVFCAGKTRRREDSLHSMIDNIRMVKNFIAAAEDRLESLVFLSSSDVYGARPRLPITEKTPASPGGYYAVSKWICERLLLFPGAFKNPVTILRLPGVYGPEDGLASLPGQILKQLLESGRARVRPAIRRDYVAVEDLCAVIGQALKDPYAGVLNVATGSSITIGEIAEKVAQAGGLSPVWETPAEAERDGDLVFDTAVLKAWFPLMRFQSISDGIREYVGVYSSRVGSAKRGAR